MMKRQTTRDHELAVMEARARKSRHPWASFLEARMRVLAWLRDEMGESPEKIVGTMRMDETQVSLLLATWDERHAPTRPRKKPKGKVRR